MVRRSTVDRSPQPATHTAGFDSGTRDLAQDRGIGRQRGQPWRGAGGRWLVWTFRVVAWLVLLVIGYRGITAIILNETPPSRTSGTPAVPPTRFPVAAAEAYAQEFADVYLNASPRTASERAAGLAQFLPAGSDPQAGWNGAGTLRLQSEQVAGVQVRDAHHAVVTLLARVNDQLIGFGVPIYAAHGGMAVSGLPAVLPAPARAAVPSPPSGNTDAATTGVLMNQLPAFFEAFASGSQVTLGRFVVPGAKVTGLGGAVKFGSLGSVTVPAGGNLRHITATVTWKVVSPGKARKAGGQPPVQLQMSYALTILKEHGTWYVKSISPSTQTGGT